MVTYIYIIKHWVPYHYPTRDLQRKPGLMEHAGNHYLYNHLNDLNAKKFQPSGDLNPGNVQYRHMPQEPHFNWDEIPFFTVSGPLKHRYQMRVMIDELQFVSLLWKVAEVKVGIKSCTVPAMLGPCNNN